MRLQYITQDIPGIPHWQLAEQACKAGLEWIQLRVKNTSFEEHLAIALQTKSVTDKFGAKLIINDSLEVARASKAHGVHLGLQDMPVSKARAAMPSSFVVGGTANTFGDIQNLVAQGADYIGLGPFRFTKTKVNLSPILGLEGYKLILDQCKSNAIRIPIIAIGGITASDVNGLLEAGVSGVAISAIISHATNKKTIVDAFKNSLFKNEVSM